MLASACVGMKGSKLRALKAAAVLAALGYCSLFVYQGGVTFNSLNFQDNRPTALLVTDVTIEADNISVSDERNGNISLDDIFITVKTSLKYSKTRLPVILKTWFQLAKNQTWFFSDEDNRLLRNHTDGHMLNTRCGSSHSHQHLCCKLAWEYDAFLESRKNWWCHFDDDNYVNVPTLVKVLQSYNHKKDWYLGRKSVYEPVTAYKTRKKYKFWFATGGAGFCISRSLGLKMSPVASGGRFMSQCEGLSMPDDITMGFVVEILTKTKLTQEPRFHSHLENLKLLQSDMLQDQISFSYNGPKEVVEVPGFDTQFDPTRFMSLHCFLFPHFEFCPR